ncbi:MAG TPA: hypothetical protein VL359_20650, partial [bacterium]|nr:hypothetical protein [bacterium]
MGGGSRWVGMVLAVLVVGGGWAGSLAHAQSWVPERRKDQFPTDQSYLAVAAPYSLPGLGAGIGLVAYETNYFGFANQGYLVYLTGDDEGFIAADQQIQVIRHRLLLDLQYGDLSKTRFQEFTFRGMNTSARDFNVLESAYAWFQPQLTLTDEERRWELFYNPYQQQTSLARIRDNAGNLTATFSPPLRTYQVINTYGASLDLTDDLHDPRQGTHLGLTVEDFPRTDAAQPDYYVTNVSASVYVPVWGISAWALNY